MSESPNPEKVRKRVFRPSSKQPQSPADSLKCIECDAIVRAHQSVEGTYFTLILCCITLILFQIWSVFLLPFVIPLSKAIVLRCSRCNSKLEVRQPFGLFSLQDEITTLKCGECALVISRSYLLTIVSLIVALLFYFWITAEAVVVQQSYTNATWPEYVSECGGEVLLKNTIRVTDAFARKYEGRTVSWDGYLMRASENYGWFRGDHAAMLLVKMQPSESDIHADLILSLDEHDLYHSKQEIARLEKGSKFRFNATFVSYGNEQQLHHLHAHNIEKIEGFMEIPEHVHTVNHRYNIHVQGNQDAIST